MDSPSEARESPRPGLSFLPALVGAMVLVAVGYWFVKDAPQSPGDWLLLLRNDDLSARYSPRGFGFSWLFDQFELWKIGPASLRLFGFVACLLGVVLLARRISRCEGVDDNTLVVAVAALAVGPWLLPAPGAVNGIGRYLAIACLGLAAWAQGLGWKRSLAVLVGLGFAAGAARGAHIAYGAAILLGALVPRRERAEALPVIGFAVGAFAARFTPPGVTLPDPQSWWVDVGIHGVFDLDLSQALLAAVGIGVALAGLQSVKRTALPWSSVVLLVALVVALVNHRVEARRWQRANDDKSSFYAALDKMPKVVPVYFVNLPAHVRPLLAIANADVATWGRVTLLETWDTGAQIHLPAAWQIPFQASVCRWTQTGFEVKKWQECLSVPSFPLASIVGKELEFRTPWEMIRAGKLVPEEGARAVESYEDVEAGKTRIRVKVGAGRATRLAVAGLPCLSQPLSDRTLFTPLVARWSLATARELAVTGAESLAAVGYLAGYGPVFSIPDGEVAGSLPVPAAGR